MRRGPTRRATCLGRAYRPNKVGNSTLRVIRKIITAIGFGLVGVGSTILLFTASAMAGKDDCQNPFVDMMVRSAYLGADIGKAQGLSVEQVRELHLRVYGMFPYMVVAYNAWPAVPVETVLERIHRECIK